MLRFVLAALLPLALLPLAAADHANCGPADGYVVEDFTLVWLEPGCLGAHAGLPPTFCANGVLVHGQVLVAQVLVHVCGVGVWLP